MKKFSKDNIKYSFFANSKYAINGLKEVVLNETSLKIELLVVLLIWITLIFIDIEFHYKAILGISSLLPILMEFINSAIERCVDLVTEDYHEMAKKAKDAGSAVVFVSIVITCLIWASCIYNIIKI
jgi:diacylglycerol kinase (ATP)